MAPSLAAPARARTSFDGLRKSSPSFSNSRANSPSCGVTTTGPGAAETMSASVLASPAKLVSASASSTKPRCCGLAPRLSAASTSVRVSGPTPRPGPMTTAFFRASSKISLSSAGPSQPRSMIEVELSRMGRHRIGRARHGHKSGTDPQGAAGREAGRTRGRHRAGDHERMAAGIFVPRRSGYRVVAAPQPRPVEQCSGRDLVREHRAGCRCPPARSPRNALVRAAGGEPASGERTSPWSWRGPRRRRTGRYRR